MNILSGSLLGLISTLFSPVSEVITIDELAHINPRCQLIEVLATYRGRVGQELQVEGFEASLTLAPVCRLPRRGKEESPMLGLTLLPSVTAGQNPEWIVVGSRLIESPRSVLRDQMERVNRVHGVQRQHLCSWILRCNLLEADDASALWLKLAPSPGDLEDGLAWIGVGRESLGNSPEFLGYVSEFHHKQEGVSGIEDQLEALGLILVADEWRDIEEFHRRLGIVERQGHLITIQRARLVDAVANWIADGDDPENLRAAIEVDIEGLIAGGTVAAGLQRHEVIIAWGTPPKVTWLRRGTRLYEGWYWPQKEVHLVNGTVFSAVR